MAVAVVHNRMIDRARARKVPELDQMTYLVVHYVQPDAF